MRINEHGEIEAVEIKPPFLRTPYNYSMDHASRATGLYCDDPTLAQQNGKDDADINTLVKRYGLTGTMPQLDRIPLQEDFTDIADFKTAMDRILAAQDDFMKLPADTRTRFNNDPNEFLNFTSDEKNREELDKMGLLAKKPAKQEPMEVIVRNPPTPQGDKPAGGPPAT